MTPSYLAEELGQWNPDERTRALRALLFVISVFTPNIFEKLFICLISFSFIVIFMCIMIYTPQYHYCKTLIRNHTLTKGIIVLYIFVE